MGWQVLFEVSCSYLESSRELFLLLSKVLGIAQMEKLLFSGSHCAT